MTDTAPQKRPHMFYAALLTLLTLWMTLPGLSAVPVIDRDESRYAQATVQMIESGDYLNIRFQDRARNKKPAGIYWAQSVPVSIFTEPGERKIWAHRLPSVLGALMAVLAVYWGGIVVFGRRGAFIGAVFMATSALLVFEAHIAKTDAMLCGLGAIALACLLRLRACPTSGTAILFWAALGFSAMVKGPVIPLIVILTVLTLFFWERRTDWVRALLNWPGIALCILIVLPWSIMIGLETNGAFFKEAIGGDLAPKIAGAQEKHGAPPGYYLGTLALLFWPGSLFLLCGLVFARKAAVSKADPDAPLAGAIRVLLAWILPYWAVLEIVPTKLPNYLLPIFPALALLCGGVAMAMFSVKAFPLSRRIGAVIFFILSLVLIVVLLSAEALYADTQSWIVRGVGVVCAGFIFVAAGAMWSARGRLAFGAGLAATAILTPVVYQSVLPRLSPLFVSHNVEAAFKAQSITLPRLGGGLVLSPQFSEPSLVYRLGTSILLGDKTDAALTQPLGAKDILLLDVSNDAGKALLQAAKTRQLSAQRCLVETGRVEGVNYSKGDPVDIAILKSGPCPEKDSEALDN